jgi:hypothetical protein
MLDNLDAFVARKEVPFFAWKVWMTYKNFSCLLLWMICWSMTYVMDNVTCSGLLLFWSLCALPGMFFSLQAQQTWYNMCIHVFLKKILIVSYGAQQIMENFKLEFERN